MPDPTPTNLLGFFTAFRARFYEGYAGTPAWWQTLAMTEPSDTSLNTYGWMDRLPAMREWIGARQVTEPITQNRSVVNRHFEITSSIDADRFRDDQYGIYNNIVREHARQAAKRHDYNLAALIEANPTCFDGQAYFSTAHPQDTSGQQSLVTYSNDLINLALNPTNIGQVKTQMRNFRGRDGKPFNVRPTLLVVPPNLEEAAHVICQNDYYSPNQFGGSSQQVGMSQNMYKGQFTYLVIPELTHANTWYAFYQEGPIRGLLVQLRQEIQMQFLVNPTDPNVFWQKEYAWGADSRENYDVTLPWYGVRCGVALDGGTAGGPA
jgi:phage major head subunit gpT-like protein